jgi:hypothetical protein
MSSSIVETHREPGLKPTVNLNTKPKIINGSKNTNQNTNGVNNQNGVRVLKPESYVGFDSLPEQYVSRIVRDGFGFNIMSLGQTGVGKTTLIDSLFNMKFPDVSTRSHSLSNVDVLCHNYELQERNIKLKLGLVESRGFGDQINKGLNLFLTLIFSTFISFNSFRF